MHKGHKKLFHATHQELAHGAAMGAAVGFVNYHGLKKDLPSSKIRLAAGGVPIAAGMLGAEFGARLNSKAKKKGKKR